MKTIKMNCEFDESKGHLAYIKEHNPDNFPVALIDPTWCEGSSARYHIDNSFAFVSNYKQFIKEVKKLYKGQKIILAQTNGFWGDKVLLTFGVVL